MDVAGIRGGPRDGAFDLALEGREGPHALGLSGCGKPRGGKTNLKHRKLMASLGWFFLSRRKSHRQVNRDGQGNRPVREVGHREDFGLVRVFQTVSPKGGHGLRTTHVLRRGSDRSCGPFCGWKRIGCRQG